ncbi:hypothetical protein FNQ90_03060 [Streptomyces alkaliphilus]|uniref:Uncharacterized protein n=1 Tax=Streptomyces alkaliphilus TaxID=1472722 RepID=A0A7W3Y0C9_9ACTN|nr:hypothetical protein [Streptomyces alkaliphilus]MBB0243115.1 hypothetical protein [Streptomyces alkaliphilus]
MGESEWEGGFDLPDDTWVLLNVRDDGAPARAALAVAERDGENATLYAEALLPELESLHAAGRRQGAAPFAVWVPETPRQADPLIPLVAYVVRQESPDLGRTVEAVAAVCREPHPTRLGEIDIREVELPLGPACRVREMTLAAETDDGRYTVAEHVTFYVLAEPWPEGILQFSVTWTIPGLGDAFAEEADAMAHTLWMARRESDAIAG